MTRLVTVVQEKKSIKWIGLPNNTVAEHAHLEELKVGQSLCVHASCVVFLLVAKKNITLVFLPALQLTKMAEIEKKHARLNELLLQQIAFKNLVARNQQVFGEQVYLLVLFSCSAPQKRKEKTGFKHLWFRACSFFFSVCFDLI